MWNYERYSAPSKIADNFYIYSKNDGLQNQSVWYKAKSINDPGTVFFDPNKILADGTAALSGSAVYRRRQTVGIRRRHGRLGPY